MAPTLATHAASKISEDHVPEDIPHVLPRLKIQDKDDHEVSDQGAFADVSGAAASVCVVVTLKLATTYCASAATSTTATSTGSHNLCCHIQLDAHCLGSTRGRKTSCRMPHVSLLDDGL